MSPRTKTADLDSGPFTNLVIRASAGTGKTFQLSNRFLALLERGVAPDQILATTFTRKAAGEILQRIVLRLATAAQDSSQRQALAGFLGRPLSRARCLELLQQLVRHLHRLRICTLDSLFGQMARAFSLELGLPPGWQIIDELEETLLRDAAITTVLRNEPTEALLRLAHLLTKGETRRGVGQLVRETVRDLHALYQETDAAAWHALPKHQPLSSQEVAGLLAQLAAIEFVDPRAAEARDKDHRKAEEEDWDEFICGGLAAKVLAGETTYYRKPLPDDAVQIYERLLKHARGVLVSRLALQTTGSYELLSKYDAARRQLQLEQGGLRFDDITQQLDLALRAASARHGSSAVAVGADQSLVYRLDVQTAHLLLDEFQDTSPRQWRVLHPFVERASRGDGHSSFFCVGDVKQAIYGWRGGVAEIFEAVVTHVPKLQQTGLATSYRSSPPIIATVNQIFHGIHRHRLLQDSETLRKWQTQYEDHSTARTDLTGYASLLSARDPTDDESPQDAVEERAADLVRDLAAASPGSEIGLLVRKNATVARLINLLRQRHVLASEEGGNPLTDSAAVQLLLSWLRLGDHPGDRVARFHLATSPLASATGLADWRDDNAARRASNELRRQLLTVGYGRTLQPWVERLRPHVSPRDQTRLDQLVEQAFLYERRSTLRIDDFLQFIACNRVADPTRAAVRVMTVHQSKGLEFDHVVLPELDVNVTGQSPSFVMERTEPTAPATRVCRYAHSQLRELLPRDWQRMFEGQANQEVSESLCLLYVALTRAVRSLHLVIAPSKRSEKSLPGTFAGLIRAALTDGKPVGANEVLFVAGVRDAAFPSPAPSPATAPADDGGETNAAAETSTPSPHEPQVIPLRQDTCRRRGLERIAPSQLHTAAPAKLPATWRASANDSAVRGTVLHAWLQQIRWRSDKPPTDEQLRDVAEPLLRERGVAANWSEWLADFRRIVSRPDLVELFQKSRYAMWGPVQLTVENERPFATRIDATLWTGSMDRVVLGWNGPRVVAAEIIDYKSDELPDSPTRDDWDSRVESYRPQMEAYRRALAHSLELDATAISVRLVFVGTGGVIIDL